MTERAVVRGGGGSFPIMQNGRGDLQKGKFPFTYKIYKSSSRKCTLISYAHFKEKKKKHFP